MANTGCRMMPDADTDAILHPTSAFVIDSFIP